MLRILGSKRRFCDGLTRRELLHASALAPFGLAMGSASAARKEAGFGRAKRCILLCLWGSPSQLETCDPKPDAPVEIRGELRSIPTALPGVRIGEIFPRTAKMLDKICVLRSLTHTHPVHGVAFATTGVPTTDIPLETNPRDPRHWPFVGSVVDHLAARDGEVPPAVPRNFGLPFLFGSKRGPARSGPFGGFLGPSFDPVWSEFRPKGIHTIERDAGTPGVAPRMVADPYAGIRPEDRFDLVPLADGITLDRLNARESLRRAARHSQPPRSTTPATTTAPARWPWPSPLPASSATPSTSSANRRKLRDQYGMTLFGQSCLVGAARAGSRRQVRHGLLGRVRPGQHRLGHARPSLPAPEERARAGPRRRIHQPARPTSTPAACSTTPPWSF